jgi:hypothetical protein
MMRKFEMKPLEHFINPETAHIQLNRNQSQVFSSKTKEQEETESRKSCDLGGHTSSTLNPKSIASILILHSKAITDQNITLSL